MQVNLLKPYMYVCVFGMQYVIDGKCFIHTSQKNKEKKNRKDGALKNTPETFIAPRHVNYVLSKSTWKQNHKGYEPGKRLCKKLVDHIAVELKLRLGYLRSPKDTFQTMGAGNSQHAQRQEFPPKSGAIPAT